MARTPSVMIPLGFKAPAFELLDVKTDQIIKSEDLFGIKGTLIMFICNHCPFVKHINEQIVQIANDYKNSGIKLIAISSNDIINYPEDSPVEMKKIAIKEKFIFPYLFDETQIVAKSYDAVCTPDFFGYNNNLELQYRGRIRELDNLKPVRAGDSDLFTAMKQIAETTKGPETQIPSVGCGIKWLDN